MENLHKQNLLECFRPMVKVPGWGIKEADGFLALKGPVPQALFNFVWARAEAPALAGARAFHGDRPFCWVLEQGQDDTRLRAAGFQPGLAATVMTLDLDNYVFPGNGPGVTVIRTHSSQDFRFWSAAAGEALGVEVEDVRAFFLPLVRQAGCVPFLVLHEGRPAATSLAFCGAAATGLYSVATREPFRRMGLGQAATHACLQLAHYHGSPGAAHVSEGGVPHRV
jgi:hypothetical protein